MAKDKNWSGWIGAIVAVVGVIVAIPAAWQVFFPAPTGCNGFLIKEKPELLSRKAAPDEDEKKYLQDKIRSCRDEIQKNDKNAVAYTNIGEATRRLGDLPVALANQQEAEKLDPNLQEAQLGRALVESDMGKVAEANKTIQDSLAQKESAIAYFYQGVAFAQQKDWSGSETAFRKAINLNSSYANAYYNLGIALGEQGKWAESIAASQKAISLNPNDAKAYTNLGNALLQQGKLTESITAFQKAISLNPNLAGAYNNLGNALREQGKLAEAIVPLQEARDLYRSQGNTQQADKITQVLKQLGSR